MVMKTQPHKIRLTRYCFTKRPKICISGMKGAPVNSHNTRASRVVPSPIASNHKSFFILSHETTSTNRMVFFDDRIAKNNTIRTQSCTMTQLWIAMLAMGPNCHSLIHCDDTLELNPLANHHA